jgi:hypothetical protein
MQVWSPVMAILAVGLSLPVAQSALAANRIEDFYGIWVDKEQSPVDCAKAAGEGPWITIGRKLFIHPGADPCEEVEMFLKEGKLRVSASCSGEEEGFTAVVAEFELNNRGELTVEGFPYVRCRGRLPKWFTQRK